MFPPVLSFSWNISALWKWDSQHPANSRNVASTFPDSVSDGRNVKTKRISLFLMLGTYFRMLEASIRCTEHARDVSEFHSDGWICKTNARCFVPTNFWHIRNIGGLCRLQEGATRTYTCGDAQLPKHSGFGGTNSRRVASILCVQSKAYEGTRY